MGDLGEFLRGRFITRQQHKLGEDKLGKDWNLRNGENKGGKMVSSTGR